MKLLNLLLIIQNQMLNKANIPKNFHVKNLFYLLSLKENH